MPTFGSLDGAYDDMRGEVARTGDQGAARSDTYPADVTRSWNC
jgi:hypothetical protein